MNGVQLIAKIRCPQCLEQTEPQDLLWIANDPSLMGDQRLGADKPLRFRASSFTLEGVAIDPRGAPSRGMACPHCHFELPRELLEKPLHILSIIGAQFSGKSYYLTAALHRLGEILSEKLNVAVDFTSNDDNERIRSYKANLFSPDSSDHRRDRRIPPSWARLDKTDAGGDSYARVIKQGEEHLHLRPTLVDLRSRGELGAVLCLYDNAGEDFSRSYDQARWHATEHVKVSATRLFLFDPLQDQQFRRECLRAGCQLHESGKTVPVQPTDVVTDRQVLDGTKTHDQVEEFRNVMERIRVLSQLSQDEHDSRMLCYVLTKYDAWRTLPRWRELLARHDVSGSDRLREPWRTGADGKLAFDLPYVRQVSAAAGELMREMFPRAYSAAIAAAKTVVFVPVSATGRGSETMPEQDGQLGGLGFRQPLAPQWVETPLLLAMWKTRLLLLPVIPLDA